MNLSGVVDITTMGLCHNIIRRDDDDDVYQEITLTDTQRQETDNSCVMTQRQSFFFNDYSAHCTVGKPMDHRLHEGDENYHE